MAKALSITIYRTQSPLRFRAQKCGSVATADETYYEPSFYFIRLGSTAAPETVISKVNGNIPLSLEECTFLQDLFHEYIHFLQDLCFPFFQRKAWCRFSVVCGLCRACEFSSSGLREVIASGVEVVAVKVNDQSIVAEMSDGSSYELTDEAIVEGLTIILDDRFSDTRLREREVPYDLPMMIARYFIKDVTPYCVDDDLRTWLVDIESAVLGVACPTRAFYDFFVKSDVESLATMCRKGYVAICRKLHQLGHKQLSRRTGRHLINELEKAYPGAVFAGFRKWLAGRIAAANRLCNSSRLGFFQDVYAAIKDESRRYIEFGRLIKRVGYPLIATPDIAYCDIRDNDVCVRYLMALHTAYIAATNGSPTACDFIPFCQSATNISLNPRASAAPKVQPACHINPWCVRQPEGRDCPFTKLWSHAKRIGRNEISSRG